jgi:hypothetical protein
VQDFENSEGLDPFCWGAEGGVEVGGANEGEKEECADEEEGPQEGGEGVVGY